MFENNVTFQRLIGSFQLLAEMIYGSMQAVYNFFGLTLNEIRDFLNPYPWVTTWDFVFDFFNDILGLGNLTVFSLMFGSGVIAVIVISIVKWIIGIIT